MPARHLALIVFAVIAAAGLTVWALDAAGAWGALPVLIAVTLAARVALGRRK